ncbi:hypothetical protein INS49_009883 [Diaporthe citri]|uniref:uncharacterized protein n=1 Tax=Diaporthe citri TaxID=83186 RepID=UPI001C82438B|nr:uncharacterized protein INS49_009883 [Diaporthe citri]KAG6361656.1 hypothetical protein INS49_009883 [Diaporthe citri]
MAGPVDLPPLQTRWQDVSTIPTTHFQQTMLAVMYLVAAVAYLTYGLRMYSRISSKQTGLEDWLMSAATVLSIAFMPVTYFYFKYTYAGFPVSEVPKTFDPTPALFWTWVVGLLYNPILALVKSSALVFMLRIAGHKIGIRWAIYIINTINICLMISTFLVVIFQTIPIAAYWDKTLPVQRSIDAASFGMSTFIMTIVTDVLVLAIPIWAFIGMKVSLATRIGVIMIFLTSGFVTIIGILRVIAFSHFFWTPGYDFANTWGPSYSAIEINLAITAACVPALRPSLRKWFPQFFRNSSSKQSGPYQKQRYYGEGRSANSRSIQMQSMGQTRAEGRIALRKPRGDFQI